MLLPLAFPFLAIAALAASAGSAIMGALQNNKARKAQQRLIDEQKADYEKEKNTPYVDTPEARAVLETAKETLREQAVRDEGRAVLGGATHEARLAARERANKGYAGIVRQVAGGANAYRNNLRQWYRSILGQQHTLHDLQAQSGNNLVQSGLHSAMGAAGNFSKTTADATTTATATDTNTSPLNGQWVDADIHPPKENSMQLT
ncbi:MAG: hypothetical protein LBF81_00165 [Prevotellaceae bacterium]|jgi:hypothetical protein|nr:hypothetical protein [Prevotellaceae bacterium]